MAMVVGCCVPLSAIGKVNERWLSLPFHLLPRGLQGWGWMQEDDAGKFALPQHVVALLERRCTPWRSVSKRKKTPDLEHYRGLFRGGSGIFIGEELQVLGAPFWLLKGCLCH